MIKYIDDHLSLNIPRYLTEVSVRLLCWVPRSIMKVKTMFLKINLICSELCFDGTHYKLQNRRSELVLNFIAKTFFVYCV